MHGRSVPEQKVKKRVSSLWIICVCVFVSQVCVCGRGGGVDRNDKLSFLKKDTGMYN